MKREYLSIATLIICVLLFSVSFAQSADDRSAVGTVTGIAGIKGGGPMPEGTVFFVDDASGPPPSATKYWRVPTHAFPSDTEGKFRAVLPDGVYYLGAIKRKSGDFLGPPQEGDYFYVSQDEKGNPKKLTVWGGSVLDLGTIIQTEPFSRESLAKKGITAIEGKVTDAQGTPVEGMRVFAYTSQVMFGRPLFVSDRTDADGKYLLRVSGSGKYYVRVRANYGGGPPAAGELMGVYKDGKPVAVKDRTVRKGINITVTRMGMQ